MLDNAIAYSPAGSEVTISSHKQGDKTVITIDDQGPGLPREVIEGIPEPFTHPGNELTEAHQGMGLSLYLSTLIMRHLGGDEIRFKNIHDGTSVQILVSAV